VHKLGEQIDVYECEIESIKSAAGKKSKKGDKDVSHLCTVRVGQFTQKDTKVADLRRRLERHKFHTQKLEILMRFVNNETIDSEKVRIASA
jgi:CCR4-NOT transcription complex subunit 3